MKNILNYDYLEGKRKLDIPNYRAILESFQGMNPLHIAISRNSFDCLKLLLEETNLDFTALTAHRQETPVILACKHAVSIEILESLLVSLRTLWPIERVKEYLEVRDKAEVKAYEYCKTKKRSDLAVVLEEFVDTTKTIVDVGYRPIEGFDFKQQARARFEGEIRLI